MAKPKYIYDKDGNVLFFHYQKTESSTISPAYWGKNAYTSDRRRVGVSYYYLRPEQREGMISGNVFVVKVDPSEVYYFNDDPDGFYKIAKKQFTQDNPRMSFDGPSQLDYMHPLIKKAGYKMVVARWEGEFRAETTSELRVDKKMTASYREYGTAAPTDADLKKNIAGQIYNKLRSISNSSVGVSSGVSDRFYKYKSNIEKMVADPVLQKVIGKSLIKKYTDI
jgi:hypothetical protein